MGHIVNCVVLKREAEGLDIPPHPGDLGVRIYENVSREGWNKWLERLTHPLIAQEIVQQGVRRLLAWSRVGRPPRAGWAMTMSQPMRMYTPTLK